MDFNEQLEAEKEEGRKIKEQAIKKDLLLRKKEEEALAREAKKKAAKGYNYYRSSHRNGLDSDEEIVKFLNSLPTEVVEWQVYCPSPTQRVLIYKV